jgi:hypothetical protein
MRLRTAAATILTAVAALPLIAAAPADAGVFGLMDKITGYEWSPRTGAVTITVVARCPKRMWHAEVGITVKQKQVKASDTHDVRCDGERHTVHLRLTPKQGRFHPGPVDAWYRTGECVSDFCGFGETELSGVRIPPPGMARGLR